MRMTGYKKEILSYFAPDNSNRMCDEIGKPPYDVFGVALMLHGEAVYESRYLVESTRRTLEAMVRDGLLYKITSYEPRQDKRICGSDFEGVWCNVMRYGLPGTRDTEGADNGACQGSCRLC